MSKHLQAAQRHAPSASASEDADDDQRRGAVLDSVFYLRSELALVANDAAHCPSRACRRLHGLLSAGRRHARAFSRLVS